MLSSIIIIIIYCKSIEHI